MQTNPLTNLPHESHDEEIHLRDYWNVILKRRWIIVAIFLTVVTTVAIYSFTMIPLYRATAQVMIERGNPNFSSMEQMIWFDPFSQDFYQTQYKLLESRVLAQEVVNRLNVDQYPEFKQTKQTKEEKTSLIASIKDFLKGLRSDQSQKPEVVSAGFDDPSLIKDPGLVSALLKDLKIEPIRNSRLVNINFQSTNPSLSALVANTYAQAYIDWSLGLKIQNQQVASRFLDEQVNETKARLEASEMALQQYREKYGIAVMGSQSTKDTGLGQDISKQKLLKINEQLVVATNNRIEKEIKYKQASDLLKDSAKAESIPEVVNNPVIISIKAQEVALLREKAEKAQMYGPKHPSMVALNQEIEKLKKQKFQEIQTIVNAMKSDYEIALSQEHSLQKALGLSQGETISRDKIAIQYQVLQQEVESNRQLYDMLLGRLKQSNVNEQAPSVNIHIIDAAEIPKAPFKPNVPKNLLLAIMVGLFMGGGMAFFLEYLDDTIKTPEDLEKHFGLTCLGPVPNFPTKEDGHPELIMLNDPTSSASEAYRVLRTSIRFSNPGHSPRSLLFTSSGPGEGKTITCANMAIAMAQAGQKTLIIDCDMRRPRLHTVFGYKENEKGMSNILVGEEAWRDCKISTDIPNLHIIPTGPHPPNPAELVGSQQMKELIAEFLSEYDLVFIDSPPIAAVTDPVELSHKVDGVVLIVEPGVTRRGIVKNGVRQLRDAQAHILGVVLNNLNLERDRYYYHHYGYYYYQHEYGYGEDDTKKKKRKKRGTRSA